MILIATNQRDEYRIIGIKSGIIIAMQPKTHASKCNCSKDKSVFTTGNPQQNSFEENVVFRRDFW